MHRSFLILIPAALLGAVRPAPAGAQDARGTWTVSGHVGVSQGSETDPSFAWRGGVHRWLSQGASLGIEAGRFRWDGVESGGRIQSLGSIEPFRGLEKGGNELQHASLALRLHAEGVGPHEVAPVLALGAGLYRQVIRSAIGPASNDARHDQLRMGVSLSVGGAATRGIAPGAEIRFDYVDTHPSPSHYLTISTGLFANR